MSPEVRPATTVAGVVIVLFGPDEVAVRHVEHARDNSAHAVVVDNTPAPDLALHERLRAGGVPVLDNRNRGGLAGAYNRGVAVLRERGCELCFLLDQDSEIPDGFFDHVARSAGAAGLGADEAFLIGPRVYEIEMDEWFPAWAATVAEPLVRPVEVLISSGSAVSAAALDRLGPFREDLFIEWVDVEYCLRAAREDVARYVDLGVTLRQRQGAITRHGGRFTTNHSAARRYYHVRNGIWTSLQYLPRWLAVYGSVRLVLREVWVAVRHERRKPQKVLAVLAGALDGVGGRLGEFAQRRPRVHRFCTR